MQCVNLTDDQLWQAIARNTNVMSALVYRRIELDAGNARNDIIDRAQLMQSNLETISKLERKYREYTDELRRRYPAPDVITVTEVEETRQVSRAEQLTESPPRHLTLVTHWQAMRKAEYFRAKAVECDQLANKATDAEAKAPAS
jgi:hypothetical protein